MKRRVASWPCLIRGFFTALAFFVLVVFAHGQSVQSSYDASGSLTNRVVIGSQPPQILGQPQRQVLPPGGLAKFNVVAADPYGLIYQWQFNGVDIAGATNDALLLPNVGVTDQGDYTAILVNISGSLTSAPAALMRDADGDGLPDAWELAQFGSLNETASGDYDHDGASNLEEFQGGTSPANTGDYRVQLNLEHVEGGKILGTPLRLSYTNGETVTLTALADFQKKFDRWSGSVNTRTNPLHLVMNGNKTLRAEFISMLDALPPPPGLVAWWRAEYDGNDSIGGNDAVRHGGLTYADGKVGWTFAMAGANDYLVVSDSPALRPASVTVEIWVMFPDGLNGSAGQIFNKGNDGYGSFGMYWDNFGNMFGVLGSRQVGTFFIPVPGEWYHFAITYDDETKTRLLYLNGVQVYSAVENQYFTIHYDDHPLVIGGSPVAMRIDEMSIYNRALSGAEIAAIYQGGGNGKSLLHPYILPPEKLPDGGVHIPYLHQMAALLGKAPVKFSVSAGTLPPQLELSSPGEIKGVPNHTTNSSFTLRATDAAGYFTEQNYALTILQPAIVQPRAWWRAENNASNSILTVDPNNLTNLVSLHNGRITGAVQYVPGKVGRAFNCGDEYFYPTGWIVCRDQPIPSPPDGPFNPPDLELKNFTLEAWVKIGATSDGIIIAKLPALSSPSSYGMRISFGGYLSGSVTDTNDVQHVISYPLPDTSQWHHFAFTYNNGSKLEVLYIDGQPVASGHNGTLNLKDGSYSGDINYCKNCAGDGQPILLGSSGFAGKIDEAAIYGGVMDADEIKALYDAGDIGKFTKLELWNLSFFGDGNTSGSDDADGDGLNNYQEFLAGTDPLDAASALRITSIKQETNDIRVTWGIAGNEIYALQFSTNLATGFQDLLFVTNAPGAYVSRVDSGAATNASTRFYRVRLLVNPTPDAYGGALKLTGNGHTMSGDLEYFWNNTTFTYPGGAKIYFDHGDDGFGGPLDTHGGTENDLAPNFTITNGMRLQVRGDYAEPNFASLNLFLKLHDNSTLPLTIPSTTVNTTFSPVTFFDSNGDQWQVSGNLETGGDLVNFDNPVPNGDVTLPYNNPDTSWHLTFIKIP